MNKWLLFVFILACSLPVLARTRDPLNDKEVDQMREAAQDPKKRVELLISFAQARLLAIQQLRSDPKMDKDRGANIHDLLEDFTTLVDQLDDNLDMYARQAADLRKPLKKVIEAGTAWQLQLRALKESTGVPHNTEKEEKSYEFVLESATESVNGTLDDARDLLDLQNRRAEASKRK